MEKSTRDSKFLFHLLYFLLVMFARILIYLLLAFFVIRGCTQCYHFGYEIFGSVSVDQKAGKEITFSVYKDDTMYQVANRLDKKGLIVSKYSFYLRSEWINPAQNELRPGKYRLNTTMNYDQIINQLTMSD